MKIKIIIIKVNKYNNKERGEIYNEKIIDEY